MRKLLLTVAVVILATTLSSAAESTKLSPRLARLLHQVKTTSAARATTGNALPTLDVLMKVDGDAAAVASQYGCELLATVGSVHVVRVPLAQIEALGADGRVVRIEAERAARKMLDVVPQQIGADKVFGNSSGELPQAFDGKGVVVGIVDVGLDYTHPMFTDENWHSRVRWAGDYISDPARVMTDEREIQDAMFSPDPTEIHGTHVAGIAAGKRVMRLFAGDEDKPFQGIAQNADIAMGAISLTGNNPILNPSDPTSATTIRAFSDIFAFADAQQKPCVINFSAGITQTFANNRQLEEEAIRTLADQPGHAIVVAAGNQGAYRYLAHKEGEAAQGAVGVMFHNEDAYGRFFGVELRMRPDQTLHIRYTNQDYTATRGELTFTPQEVMDAEGQVLTKKIGSVVYLRHLTATYAETDDEGYVIFSLTCDDATFPETDRLLLTIEGGGEAWIYADTLCAPLEDTTATGDRTTTVEGCSVAWPASMDEVIAVGNIGWRYEVYGTFGAGINVEQWEKDKGEGYLSKSSSRGPTLDGRIKPDVCAPGVCVVSAQNNGLGWGLPSNQANALEQQYQYDYMGYIDAPEREDFDENNPAHVWNSYYGLIVQTGTSMAAPAVAGTIALWMQADPTLTTGRIKNIIAHSSRQPEPELTYPNSLYGYGEIDAYKGLLHLLDPTGVINVSRHQPQQAAIVLSGRQLDISFANGYDGPFTVSVYATDGRLLLTADNDSHVSLAHLPKGVYAIQVTTGQRTTTGSTLVRL